MFGRDWMAEKGMGGILAVSQGSAEEPQLIVLRYAGGGDGPTLGLVGKGVTFDTGGISIKPSSGMHEMKMDMSGAAAVLEAVTAIAELGLAVDLVAVIPSTENMPSGTAVKPGDVITQYGGKTVEVNNTDAEGRLILADALAYAVELGAERIVDLATLTGAVLIALGSTYAAVISNDDELAAEVESAGEASGELVWRLPLHPEFKALMKGTVADLSNLASKRKAGTITAAEFLRGIRRRDPLGARRHRRHRLGRRPRVHRQRRQRLRRAAAGRAGALRLGPSPNRRRRRGPCRASSSCGAASGPPSGARSPTCRRRCRSAGRRPLPCPSRSRARPGSTAGGPS